MTDLRKKRTKAPLDTKISCSVCATVEPLATAHDHHRTPRAFGGTDDEANRVWLCASCHTRLHRVQEFLVQGKTSSAYELCQYIFPTKAKSREELWTLAQEAAAAEQEVQGAFDLHRSSTTVNLTIDVDVWAAIKAMAIDNKTTAKKMAIELLRRAIGRHG